MEGQQVQIIHAVIIVDMQGNQALAVQLDGIVQVFAHVVRVAHIQADLHIFHVDCIHQIHQLLRMGAVAPIHAAVHPAIAKHILHRDAQAILAGHVARTAQIFHIGAAAGVDILQFA